MDRCGGNTLACRKYHERNKDKPEYKLRKIAYGRRFYYRKRYMRFYKIFQAWKALSAKDSLIAKALQVRNIEEWVREGRGLEFDRLL